MACARRYWPDAMRPLPAVSAVLAAAALTIAASGCGTQTFKTDDLQSTITKDLAAQNGLKEADLKVQCPDDPKAEKGTKFTCDLTGKDIASKINVTVTDDDGGFDYEVVDAKP